MMMLGAGLLAGSAFGNEKDPKPAWAEDVSKAAWPTGTEVLGIGETRDGGAIYHRMSCKSQHVHTHVRTQARMPDALSTEG